MCSKTHKKYNDEQLVNLIQQGNMNAMGELYVRYFPLVRSRCISFTKNKEQADDFAQDVMLKVMDKISSFKGISKFSTWIYSITVNYCMDHVRKANFFYALESNIDLMTYDEIELESALKMEKKYNNAELALAAVSKKDQQLLTMKYQYNKSIKELMVLYDLSASAVKMRLSRAREKATSLYFSKMLNHAA